jgi:hypothetical protein
MAILDAVLDPILKWTDYLVESGWIWLILAVVFIFVMWGVIFK